MDKHENLATRLNVLDEQLASAVSQREQLDTLINDLSRQRKYVSWLLDVSNTRSAIKKLSTERDVLEEHLAEERAGGDEAHILESTLHDVVARLVTAEDMLAELLANPPGSI